MRRKAFETPPDAETQLKRYGHEREAGGRRYHPTSPELIAQQSARSERGSPDRQQSLSEEAVR